ncbi:hypothetical protein CLAFUW4_07449 [Fulvia fulva]|uniref:ASST-domain-containing protein n=1 Tax=Passalora fulva TaxID=5499 RepID=A0A9Q8PAR7_PASFU|nr:uncharacterized protein CLAFUR5_07579 [Fulvia fulva]KAK4621983.1 hypothetical protein CLAFUR4_07456 [Fulvia fulva]KAK4623317.1 hypothetical protein CLAFUR0_07455 [Fulvia fulva]UJO19040.1 hypothetical protein CLAFUR5_07579 [Fulvia fulva]WPV15915.1 hypothetical protein CLAFUW4_07449 [Fulvia fulva]WPV30756.1 hypothetical protein CLAFUW7_07452 [Fulvia fulva]
MPVLSLKVVLTLFLGICVAANVPVISYVTRPDILTPNLTFTSFDRTKVTPVHVDKAKGLEPGYIFLSTYKGAAQHAPYIFDNQGNLVWSGYDSTLSDIGYFDFQSHRTSNSSLLSVFRGYADSGRGKGHVAFLDQEYKTVRTLDAPAPLTSLDFHEFQLLDDGQTAIVTSLQPIQADLAAYGINETMGWLLDSAFYVLELQRDNQIVFEWRSSDHIPLNESAVTPSIGFGAGLSYGYAYDYFHLNSIARFQNGDYLLSARHTNTLYRIAGTTGKVLWRLGGPQSSFTQDRFNFSSQHDARILHESSDGTIVLSLFDNAHNGIVGTNGATNTTSSALILSLDERKMTAYPVEQYFLPPHEGSTAARALGSIQRLPNGNSLVSWGYLNTITEFAPGGHPLLNIAFNDEDAAHYRVHKGNWTASPPVSELAVYVFAPDATQNTHIYISWNGATEVRAWRVYGTILTNFGGSETDEIGLFLGQLNKTGFETHFDAKRFVTSAWVSAIDIEGNVLGKSEVMKTIVPREEVRERCGKTHCVKQILMQEAEAKWGSGPVCAGSVAGGVESTVVGLWLYVQTFVFFLLGMGVNTMFSMRATPWWRW